MTKVTNIVLDASIDPISAPEAQAKFFLDLPAYSADENQESAFGVERAVRLDQTLTVDWAIINASVTPNFGTITFLPGNGNRIVVVLGGSVNTTEVGTVELSNPQYVSGVFSAPILGSPSISTFTVFDTDSSAKRWNPHHGYKIQGDAADVNQANYWNKVTIGIGPTSPVHDSDNLKGVLFGVAWGTIEPTLGQRNWVELDQAFDDAITNIVQVNIQFTFKNFREDAGLIGPADLSADRLENVNANGTPVNTMAMHREHVMTRYIAILIEVISRYGSRTQFEILSSAELLLSFGTGSAPADYSRSALATQNKRMHQEVGLIITPVNFMPNINQLSGEMTDLMESLYINRIGHGSPDLRETPGHSMFKGDTSDDGQVPIRDYRGELGKQSIVSFQDWLFGAFTDPADILANVIPDYGLTHLYWANQETGPFTWADFLIKLDANPDTLITACPNRWPGCSIAFPEEHFPQVSVTPGAASLSLPANSAMLVIGMSNTNQYIDELIPLAGASKTEIVNGAQGGAASAQWAISGNAAWTNAASTLSSAGFSANDVSVVFIGMVDRVFGDDIDTYEARLETQLRAVVVLVRQKYPNAIMIMNGLHNEFWASSHPEPHAWMSSTITTRIVADESDVYWGPYIWNPIGGRSGDGFNITEADHQPNGNVHLTTAGSLKVANIIMTWFQTDSIGQSIFN